MRPTTRPRTQRTGSTAFWTFSAFLFRTGGTAVVSDDA